MSTPATRAALRILQSVPPDAIRTHERKPSDIPIPGTVRATTEQGRRLRAQMVALLEGGMSYRQIARHLDVPVYMVNNHLRIHRGYVWKGKRKR